MANVRGINSGASHGSGIRVRSFPGVSPACYRLRAQLLVIICHPYGADNAFWGKDPQEDPQTVGDNRFVYTGADSSCPCEASLHTIPLSRRSNRAHTPHVGFCGAPTPLGSRGEN